MEEGIIYKYMTGLTTVEEDKELLDWLNASEENRNLFFELKTIWNKKSGFHETDSFAIHRSLDLLNQRIDTYAGNSLESTDADSPAGFVSAETVAPIHARSGNRQSEDPARKFFSPGRRLLFLWSSVTALVIGLGGLFFYFKESPNFPATSSLHTLKNVIADSVLQVHLVDGSTVWLNTDASLAYPESFTGSRREVHLEGNAFFEVARDSLHPFVVSTGLYEVEVLGTSFCINISDSEDLAETILLEGSIRLRKNDGKSLVDLRPGQQALYSKSLQTVEVKEIDARQHALWRFGLISLSDVSLEEILAYLEQLYHIRIQMDIRKFLHHRYNFSFKQSGGPEDALRHLFYLTGTEATILR